MVRQDFNGEFLPDEADEMVVQLVARELALRAEVARLERLILYCATTSRYSPDVLLDAASRIRAAKGETQAAKRLL